MTDLRQRDAGDMVPGTERDNYMRVTLAGLAGPLCWVLHFALMYVLEGFLCRSGATGWIVGIMLVTTLVFVGACAVLTFFADRLLRKAGAPNDATGNFLTFITSTLAGLSFIAILWTASGLVFLRPCALGY